VSVPPNQPTVGLFATYQQARDAIGALKAAGISPGAISVLARSPREARALHRETGAAEDLEAAVRHNLLRDVLALVGQIESVLVPGFGGVLGSGDLITAIRVRGPADEDRGAIAGALVGLGVPVQQAADLEQAVAQGQILVVVHGAYDAAAARAALGASPGG
jgi:Heat induced stress protein YflT